MTDDPGIRAVSALLRLYPAAWRERYGDEVANLLAGRPLSLRDGLDLVRGAFDAHCNLSDLLGRWSVMVSRLRSTAVTTFQFGTVSQVMTYTITLIASDGHATANLSKTITFSPLLPPTGLKTTNGRSSLSGLSVTVSWTDAPQSSTDSVYYDLQVQTLTGGCLFSLFDLNTNGGGARVPASPPVQTYNLVDSSGFLGDLGRLITCSHARYQVQVRTVRTADGQTYTSAWSAPSVFGT